MVKNLNQPDSATQIKVLLKDSNLWLGLLTLIAIILGLVMVYVRIADKIPPNGQISSIQTPFLQKIDPPLQKSVSATEVVSEPEILEEINPKSVQVQKGDNFWRISQKNCGTGRYYLKIQEENNYTKRALKQGDILKVSCS